MNLTRYVLLIFCMMINSHALSEIYKWTDQHGNVHFSDKASTRYQAETLELKINTYESVSYDTSSFDTGKNVVIYTTNSCGYCKKAKHYFNKQGIRFTEKNIETSASARAEYKKTGATGVPVIFVGKKRMNGFSETGFQKIYN